MTDLDPYIAAMREHLTDLVDATDLEPYREAFEAAVAANREAREHHESELLRIQDRINRRAAAYGEAWEQTLRMWDE